jgi:outer membrane protein OmpA-like peptidoglycan-associated protein
MSAMRQLWSHPAFIEAVKKTAAPTTSANGDAPGDQLQAFASPEEPEDAQGGGGSGGSAQASTPADARKALDPTSTDLFFDWKSPALTAPDKESLDSYANVYLMAKSPKTVVVDAYASAEGDPTFNQNLSQQRADIVAAYLRKKGVPVAKAKGHGAIGSLSDDLRQNRRATISPPPLEHLVTGVDKPQDNKKPNLSLGEKAPEPDVPPVPPPPPETVSRDEVEAELTQFLLKLGKWQKHKDNVVVATITVSLAETRLREGLEGEPFMKPGGDGKGYQAAELAHSIAQQLPDEIPKENFDNFKKLKPEDTPQPKSALDRLKDWADKGADQILSKLGVPKELWPTIKDAFKNHTRDVLDKLPLDPKLKDGIEQIYDKLKDGGDDK